MPSTLNTHNICSGHFSLTGYRSYPVGKNRPNKWRSLCHSGSQGFEADLVAMFKENRCRCQAQETFLPSYEDDFFGRSVLEDAFRTLVFAAIHPIANQLPMQ